jgi:alcohol dehydrogenase, propanol-preferring
MVLPALKPIEENPLELQEVAAPQPGEGEIRLRVQCCGTCRTDLHVIEGDLPQKRLPLIPGHEIVGVVDAVGPGCKKALEGRRMGIAWLRYTCGRCSFCKGEHENLCESARFTGYHEHGGYAEYAVVREDFAYEIPDVFDSIHAAPLLCAGIIGYRALERARPVAGGTIALYGFGSSAHVVLQIAKHRGIRAFVVSRRENHRQLARELGAEWTGASTASMPERVDSAILFAPVGSLVPQALEGLKKGGTLAVAGIYLTDIPGMRYEDHLFYERDLRSVTSNTREDGRALLEEAARVPVKTSITAYPLEEANRALQDMKAGRVNGTAVLVIGDQ